MLTGELRPLGGRGGGGGKGGFEAEDTCVEAGEVQALAEAGPVAEKQERPWPEAGSVAKQHGLPLPGAGLTANGQYLSWLETEEQHGAPWIEAGQDLPFAEDGLAGDNGLL